MKRETKIFSHDFKLEMSGEEIDYDPSHIYTGEIFGETHTFISTRGRSLVRHTLSSTLGEI